MQHTDEMTELSGQEQPLDIKELLYKIISKWYWFAICGFIGLTGSYIYNKYKVSIWQVEATILVSDASKKPGIDNLFESLSLGTKVNMQNHIGLLKSYTLSRRAIDNLPLRTSWFQKGQFIDDEFYKNEPFRVIETQGWFNDCGIPVFIKMISDDLFEVSCDYKDKINGKERKITLKQNGKLGVPIVSPWFRFTLEKDRKSTRLNSSH